MTLEAPNFFDEAEFQRMRTPSNPYDLRVDYSLIVSQLRAACHKFEYPGVSPQNLVTPAELLPVIVIRQKRTIRNFVNPKLIEVAGKREQVEACANLYLIKNGTKRGVGVRTERPTFLMLSYVNVSTGREVTTSLRDELSKKSFKHSTVGVICHELDHLQGRLLADIARDRLVKLMINLRRLATEIPELEKAGRIYAQAYVPHVLQRDGSGYILRHGMEFEHEPIPPVSPNAMFADYFFKSVDDMESTFVPRGGELLPIQPSETFLSLSAR